MKTTIAILALILAFTSRAANESFSSPSEWWLSLPDIAKETYLDGFKDGTIQTWIEAKKAWLPKEPIESKSPKIEAVRKKVFTIKESSEIIKMMDTLYHDSENSLIQPLEMVFASRDKLLGKDIEALLIRLRSEAEEDLHYRTHTEFEINE